MYTRVGNETSKIETLLEHARKLVARTKHLLEIARIELARNENFARSCSARFRPNSTLLENTSPEVARNLLGIGEIKYSKCENYIQK